MKVTFGRIVILVNDYDEAFEFYKRNFNCAALFDMTTEHGQRFLHIGFGEPSVGIWFLKAESSDDLLRVGAQTGRQPVCVLYTDSLNETYERLQKNGVKIVKGPVIEQDFSFLHFLDLYGNEIVLVELKK